jgi:hypothetical protein
MTLRLAMSVNRIRSHASLTFGVCGAGRCDGYNFFLQGSMVAQPATEFCNVSGPAVGCADYKAG